MYSNQYEALEFIKENDVQFIRLQFCDIFGELKNVSIMSSELERAFKNGISFDASSVKGFLDVDDSDLFLVPDASTLTVLPWRPQHGRVVRFLCDIKRTDGSIFDGDNRNILKRSIMNAEEKGYDCMIGPECEFFLFKTDEFGNSEKVEHDKAGYFAVAPNDRGENVRRSICLTLKEMNIAVESSHHESGMGQHEIDIKYDKGLVTADNIITLKTVISTIAQQNGLYASFMPKPVDNTSGSGLHINMSLKKDGVNLFAGNEMSDTAKKFIAGIMAHIKGICLFSNPTVNSYKRLMTGFQAPKHISWSRKNRSQLIRIPEAHGDEYRMELRCPDPQLNPYLTFALLIEAGIWGIENNVELPGEVNLNLYTNPDSELDVLPANLFEAIECAKKDELIKKVIGENVFDKYINLKLKEWESYQTTVSEWEIKHYF